VSVAVESIRMAGPVGAWWSEDSPEMRWTGGTGGLTVGQRGKLPNQPGDIQFHPILVQLANEITSLLQLDALLVKEILFRVGHGDDPELVDEGRGGELGQDRLAHST
jgi:hypothetical protein